MKRIIAIIVTLIMLATAIVGCGGEKQNNSVAYNLYFVNQDKTNLVCEVRNIVADDYDSEAEAVIEELLNGPKVAVNSSVIPDGTKLLDVSVKEGIASVNFSKAYYRKDDANADTLELLARYSVVNTLCDIEGINKVKIFVDGVELMNSSNVPVGALGKEDILLNSSGAESVREQELTLYFPDKNLMNLFMEERKVPVIDNSVEKTIVLELIKGSSDSKLAPSIPEGTKVLSVETKDGICFVNLSSDFITKHSGGSSAEVFTIYSVVNSLTELENINKVQFLIEGKKQDTMKHMLIDSPFERDESYIVN